MRDESKSKQSPRLSSLGVRPADCSQDRAVSYRMLLHEGLRSSVKGDGWAATRTIDVNKSGGRKQLQSSDPNDKQTKTNHMKVSDISFSSLSRSLKKEIMTLLLSLIQSVFISRRFFR